MKFLFICECNLNRSPTFEKWFNANTPHEAKSTGTQYGYPDKLTQKLLDWADKVFVMDLGQLKFIEDRNLLHDDIIVIGISDQYDPDEDKLIELIKFFWKRFRNE